MKLFTLKAFSVLSAITALVYLVSCLTPFIGANTWLPMGLLGLGFPILLCCLFLLIIIWVLINRKIALLLFVFLLFGFKNIKAVIGFHANQPFKQQKQPNAVRILGYNVRNFDAQINPFDTLFIKRHQILDYIAHQNADIVCLQDFSELHNPLVASNFDFLYNTLQYHNYFFADNYNSLTPWNLSQIGVAIFSRYPLKNIQYIKYSGKVTPEGFIMADVTINNITRRIVTTHLQSMWLGNKEKLVPSWYHSEDAMLNYYGGKFEKIEHYLPYHAVQANELKRELDKSPYPIILSMDMNEVPSSYCYHTIRGNLKDAFLQKGFGFGRTYFAISPTLRIDYLMMDPSIEILQYKCDRIFMSDHYPQVIDVKW